MNQQNTLAPFPPPSGHRTLCPLLGLIFSPLLALLLTGCASPTPPRPPSLNLPGLITDLTAARSGDTVLIRWTNPDGTTDGTDIRGPFTAQICRQAPNSICIPTQSLPQKTGPTSATETLPPNLTTGPASLLEYHVRLLNTAKRSAAPSNPAYTAAGAVPPPIQDLHAIATRTGIQLQWQPAPASSPAIAIELARHHEGEPAPPATPTKQPLAFTPKSSTTADIRLQTPTDAGGTLDRTARKGETYRYTAQRVLMLTLNGHAVELRSAPSTPVTLNLRDTFPPAPPINLATIPVTLKATLKAMPSSTTTTAPASPASIAIDLSWEPTPDTDIAGYHVYRQPLTPEGLPQGPSTRITPAPTATPAYRDQTITPGQRYNYRITAIDASGNESQPTPPTQETAPTR